jgi:hypothetical protein
VLDLADHVAPGHDEDGVAAVLEDLFGLDPADGCEDVGT